MEDISFVKIVGDHANNYATVERACLTAMNACMRVGNDTMCQQLMVIKNWAADCYAAEVESFYQSMITNPALG